MAVVRLAALALCSLVLGACVPPPEGVAPPAATEAGGDRPEGEEEVRVVFPAGTRPVGLRITVNDPGPELLDENGAGVLTLSQGREHGPIHLVFLNGSLAAYALTPGIYRIDSIAGYRCGDLHLVVPDRDAPLALGGLVLDIADARDAFLGGALPPPEELGLLAGLVGADEASVESEPLERRRGIACERRRFAVSRPDVDPTFRKWTPLEIALGVVFLGVIGAATGAAAATGTVVFTSGAGGGMLFGSF